MRKRIRCISDVTMIYPRIYLVYNTEEDQEEDLVDATCWHKVGLCTRIVERGLGN